MEDLTEENVATGLKPWERPWKITAKTIFGSYGVMTTVFEFLPRREVNRFQALNKFMYRQVGAIQTRMPLFDFQFTPIESNLRQFMFHVEPQSGVCNYVQDSSFDFKEHSSIMVGHDLYTWKLSHFVRHIKQSSNMLKMEQRKTAVSRVVRQLAMLANAFDKYLYLVGGKVNTLSTETCQGYDIKLDKYFAVPSMHSSRWWGGCCVARDYLYAFCGASTGWNPNDSIERLNVRQHVEGGGVAWEIISKNAKPLWGKKNIACLTMSDDEILIMGGYGLKSEVCLFDVAS